MPQGIVWIVLLALLSSGCTTMQWSKLNASQQDLAGDQADCRAEVDANTNNTMIDDSYGVGLVFSNYGISTQLYSEPGDYRVDSCLTRLGWGLRPR
ncbi:hypothetical protein [Phytohalomonas tamaricis]|uniref:hypothetical protein n=1 Tax=Phytohalomonas tamaricis TaxID=2081032 RepID=UPI00131A26C2|nr:hypothetical protein [Phytohalomonas tamaricis]